MNNLIPQAKKDFSRIGLSLFVIAGVTTVLQVVFAWLWSVTLQETPIGNAEWVIWIITFAPLYLIGMPIGLLLMRKVPAENQPAAKLGFKRFLALFLICMPIMYGGNIIGTVLSALLSGGTAENALIDYVMSSPLYTMIFAVLLAPFLEEYIFRKQIIDRLGKYGETTAILFSAITFGLFHMNLFQFFYAFGLGVLFAYIYTRTRKLIYPTLLHMIINFQGSVLAPWLVNNIDLELITGLETGEAALEEVLEILPGLAAYLLYSNGLLAAVIAGLVLLIVNWKKRQILPASQELPFPSAWKTAYLNLGMVLFGIFCLVMIVLALL